MDIFGIRRRLLTKDTQAKFPRKRAAENPGPSGNCAKEGNAPRGVGRRKGLERPVRLVPAARSASEPNSTPGGCRLPRPGHQKHKSPRAKFVVVGEPAG